jgi:tetratricopeptide (TPR) repeat protein
MSRVNESESVASTTSAERSVHPGPTDHGSTPNAHSIPPAPTSELDDASDSPRARLRARELHYFRQLLRQPGEEPKALRSMGRLWLASGQPHRALAAFTEALKWAPDGADERIAVCEARIECGDVQTALDELEQLFDEHPDAWVVAAQAAEAASALDEFPRFLSAAVERAPAGFRSIERKDTLRVLIALFELYQGSDELGSDVAGFLPAIALRAPLSGDLEPRPEWADRVHRCVKNLALSGKVERIEPFLEPRAEALIPGAGRAAREALISLGADVVDNGEPTVCLVNVSNDADQAFVSGVLKAHEDLRVHCSEAADPGSLARALAAQAGQGARQVWVTCASSTSALAEAFPKARVLGLPRKAEPRGAGDANRFLQVGFDDLLSSPVEVLAKVLAFMGERPHPGPLRRLIDTYPGRASLEVAV